jgi:hypothetical protein
MKGAKVMALNNPKRNSGELKSSERLSPEDAERKMKLTAEGELGFWARKRVAIELSRQAKETGIQLARDNGQATREIGKEAIEIKKQQIKLTLIAGNMDTISCLQKELYNRYAIAGEEMLSAQSVATRSLIRNRADSKQSLLAEARGGHINEQEAAALLDDEDQRTAEQETRLIRVADACHDNLERLTLSVVQEMKATNITKT